MRGRRTHMFSIRVPCPPSHTFRRIPGTVLGAHLTAQNCSGLASIWDMSFPWVSGRPTVEFPRHQGFKTLGEMARRGVAGLLGIEEDQ